jgi:hypothetical protein
MGNNNLGTTFVIIFIVTIFMALIYTVSEEVKNKNPNLDLKSQSLITDLRGEYVSDFQDGQSLATLDTTDYTYEGTDPYYRSTAEDKEEINTKKGTLETIITFPQLFIKMFGVENNVILIAFNVAFFSLMSLLIGLQIYKAVRTGEVD